MPHTPVPAEELTARLGRLRTAMSARYPDWSMLLLDNKDRSVLLHRHHAPRARWSSPRPRLCCSCAARTNCARQESPFPDIRPMGSFRAIREAFADVPETVYVAARTMTLQKLGLAAQASAVCAQGGGRCALLAARGQRANTSSRACAMRAGCTRRSSREGRARAAAPRRKRGAPCAARSALSCSTAARWGFRATTSPAAEDVLGIASFSENSLRASALDSPSGGIGTCIAMKSIGSSERCLREGDTVLLDIPLRLCGLPHGQEHHLLFRRACQASAGQPDPRRARAVCVSGKRDRQQAPPGRRTGGDL